MTVFFKKYKWTILYGAIIFFFLFYFTPRQSKYYLDRDIKQFKAIYLIPTLIWIFGFLAFGLLVFWSIKTKSAKQSITAFLSTIFTFGFIIFFFKDIFLGIALFANRQTSKEKITQTYESYFMSDSDYSKNNFLPYDPLTKGIISDPKLINELYHPGLKQNDTVILTMNKGLFGVMFSSHQFDDKY